MFWVQLYFIVNIFSLGLILKPMQICVPEILKNSNGMEKRCKKNIIKPLLILASSVKKMISYSGKLTLILQILPALIKQ
jgi:hypothetical protein